MIDKPAVIKMLPEMLLLKAPEHVAQWKRSPEIRDEWRSCGKIGMFCIEQLMCDKMIRFRPVHNYRKDKIKMLMCSKNNLSVAASHTNVLSDESFQVFLHKWLLSPPGRAPFGDNIKYIQQNSRLTLLTRALLHPGNGTHNYYRCLGDVFMLPTSWICAQKFSVFT